MDDQQRMISLGFDPGRYPAATHMCLLYNSDDERRRIMAQYIQSGIEGGDQVGYFVDSMSPEEMNAAFRQLGVDLDADDGGQFYVRPAEEVYCPDGTFQVQRMLDTIEAAHERSVAEGFAGTRLAGEMTWSRKGYPGSEGLIEYESRINVLLRTVPVAAICQYDAREFDGATLFHVLSVHPMMIVHGQVLRNPYYVEPEEFLARPMQGAGV